MSTQKSLTYQPIGKIVDQYRSKLSFNSMYLVKELQLRHRVVVVALTLHLHDNVVERMSLPRILKCATDTTVTGDFHQF